MIDYSQPEFYRFNQDSLDLVTFILEQHLKPKNILDLGAGCGILGIELARNLQPDNLTLLELQEEFRTHLSINVNHFLPSTVVTTISISPFSEWVPSFTYDLIVLNPPYYLPGRGQPSSDVRRGQARSFQQDNWAILLHRIHLSLAPTGKAYLVIKNDQILRNEIVKNLQPYKLKSIFHEKNAVLFLELSHLD